MTDEERYERDDAWRESIIADGERHVAEVAALNKLVRELLDAAGVSADVDEGRDPVEALRAFRRQAESDADEALTLRTRIAKALGCLSPEGLHVVTDLDKAALDALDDMKPEAFRSWLVRGFTTVEALAKAALARKGEL